MGPRMSLDANLLSLPIFEPHGAPPKVRKKSFPGGRVMARHQEVKASEEPTDSSTQWGVLPAPAPSSYTLAWTARSGSGTEGERGLSGQEGTEP